MRVSATGASAAAGGIHPQAAAGEVDPAAVSGDGPGLLPFDFATVLWAVTGDDSLALASEAAATPDKAKPAPTPEEPEPAGWRPGTGWLAVPDLYPLAFSTVPIGWDRAFGFAPAAGGGGETTLPPTAPPPGASPVPAPGAAEPFAGPAPNPVVFQLMLTEAGVVPAAEAANPGAETPAPTASAALALAERPAGSELSPAREPALAAGRVPADQPVVPDEPAAAPGEGHEAPRPAVHPVTAESKRESAGGQQGKSSGSGPGEGHPQRPPERPVHAISSPAPSFEAAGPTLAPQATSGACPQPVAAATPAPPAAAPVAAPITTSVNALHIRLESAGAPQPVDLHVRERGGEIHVAVRGADPGLSQELRQDLPSLLRRLEEQGFRGEAWAGGEVKKLQSVGGADGAAGASAQNGHRDGEPSRGREQQERDSHHERDPSRQRRGRDWQQEWMEIAD